MKKISIKNILVPIDFSPLSHRAIEVAQHLAQPFSATVHLVHVHEYHPLFDYMKPAAPIATPLKAFRETAGQHIASDLGKLAKKYGVSGANCYIQEGASIFNEVCNVAGTINADLIVISTHGRTGVKHVVLGSTAERIVQHSPFPVLVVPSHPEVRVGQLTKARPRRRKSSGPEAPADGEHRRTVRRRPEGGDYAMRTPTWRSRDSR